MTTTLRDLRQLEAEARQAEAEIADAEAQKIAEAKAFLAEHGYPIDAKRLPAGQYRLTAAAWNQPDPSAPAGVRLRVRGEVLTLTEHEASRLLHARAIDDPDVLAARREAPSDAEAAIRAHLDKMDDQIERYRDPHRREQQLLDLRRRRKQREEDRAELEASISSLDEEIQRASDVLTMSDDEIAAELGETFVNARATLRALLGMPPENGKS